MVAVAASTGVGIAMTGGSEAAMGTSLGSGYVGGDSGGGRHAAASRPSSIAPRARR